MQLIKLKEAAQLAPGKPHPLTVWRWCREGLRARDGSLHRLEHRRAGRAIYTSAEWMEEFFRALSDADLAGLAREDEGRKPRRERVRFRRGEEQ